MIKDGNQVPAPCFKYKHVAQYLATKPNWYNGGDKKNAATEKNTTKDDSPDGSPYDEHIYERPLGIKKKKEAGYEITEGVGCSKKSM